MPDLTFTTSSSNTDTDDTEVAGLDQLSSEELKARFLQLRGVPLPRFMRRGLMLQAVAHAVREHASGGLDPLTRRRLDELMRTIVPTGERAPVKPNRKIKAGTRLVREWQGRVHEVTVVVDGFVWSGQRHRSLSEIARAITGTRWNGWTFFGLKRPTAQSAPSSQQERKRCPPAAALARSFLRHQSEGRAEHA
jgi:hypothetical protein